MAPRSACGSWYVVDRQQRGRVQSRGDAFESSHGDKPPHVPPPSLWPIGFAVGIACVLTGLVLSWAVAAVGVAISVIFGFLWIRDVTSAVREPAPAVEPEQRPASVAPVAVPPPADD